MTLADELMNKSLLELAQQTNSIELERYYAVPRILVKAVAKRYINALALISDGGFGKSHLVLQTLAQEKMESGKDFIYTSTYSTPLALYMSLYDNKDKLMIFDDVEGIMRNKLSISILKSALWSPTDARIVSYCSSKRIPALPQRFVFEGSIIVCMNELPKSNPSFMALLSRMIIHNIDLTLVDRITIIQEIAKQVEIEGLTKEDIKNVVDFLSDNITTATDNVNIRILFKALRLYRYSKQMSIDWRIPIRELLNNDEEIEILEEVIALNETVSEQVRAFSELTGKSRRAFFYLKAKLQLLKGEKCKSAKVQKI